MSYGIAFIPPTPPPNIHTHPSTHTPPLLALCIHTLKFNPTHPPSPLNNESNLLLRQIPRSRTKFTGPPTNPPFPEDPGGFRERWRNSEAKTSTTEMSMDLISRTRLCHLGYSLPRTSPHHMLIRMWPNQQ